MRLPPETYAVVAVYILFALVVGIVFARRAGRDVEQFFLSGRSLPWWMAGTSMVATTFASDTPLVITGWVREHGIYQNWMWWCLAGGGLLTAFLFARYWRRGEVVTSAELAELRYGGREARVLRFVQGVFQAGITNTIIMCWVILAAAKILDVLFEVDKGLALTLACLLALSYSMLAGFWGVVVTDLVQFAMAMVGAVALAWFAWDGIGGAEGLAEHASALRPDTLSFFPPAGDGGVFDASFWTVPLATVCVFLGVQWWATDQVDGGGLAVQRISAARTERDGMIGTLWFNIAHYALRPWPWILVAVASLIVLPRLDVTAPVAGNVVEVGLESVTIQPADGAPRVVPLEHPSETVDWRPSQVIVATDAEVAAGDVLARTDPERAYVVMALRYLGDHPLLLGLVIASLLAAFMSTIDTHVNLAASFFVNDLYRRFFRKSASDRHYVWAGRFASAGALAVAGLLAFGSDSISHLFTFFMAFLSGVGPVYILRWLWWRVRAGTEIVAMVTSSVAATWLTFDEQIASFLGAGWLASAAAYDWGWLGSLSEDGEPGIAGRLVLVVLFSGSLSLLSLLLMPRPDPRSLVSFYSRVRPIGRWGPVRAHCPEIRPPHEARAIFVGWGAGLASVYGTLFALGGYLLGRPLPFVLAWASVAAVGALAVTWSLRNLRDSTDLGDDVFVTD